MNDHGVVTEPGTIRFERLLPGPIELVWAYLTDSEKRATWLASGPMELRIGGRVKLTFSHADLTPHRESGPEQGCGGGFLATVTRCEPPRILSHTWGGGQDELSEVTYELTPRGDMVLLVLTHRRLANRAEAIDVAGGWHTHLGILVDRLDGRAPRPFWAIHDRVTLEYEERLSSF
jgi:uncharacterized protein YndB with AHSA1/START domain